MGTLERFTEFADTLSPERRGEIEAILEQIMASETAPSLTPEQLAELDRRAADPDPDYVTLEEFKDNSRTFIDALPNRG